MEGGGGGQGLVKRRYELENMKYVSSRRQGPYEGRRGIDGGATPGKILEEGK